jgi:hypothetical protein
VIWQDREIKEEKNEKKKDHQGHTDDLFLTHSVLLERSRQDDSNHTLKDHQIVVLIS